jgi:hypothetical protein
MTIALVVVRLSATGQKPLPHFVDRIFSEEVQP